MAARNVLGDDQSISILRRFSETHASARYSGERAHIAGLVGKKSGRRKFRMPCRVQGLLSLAAAFRRCSGKRQDQGCVRA